MANNLDASISEYWSRRMQRKHYVTDVFRAVANFEEQNTLKNGDTVHRPYRSNVIDQDYTRGTAVSIQDLTTTDESLVVNKAKVVPFYIDDLDELQNSYAMKNSYADDCAEKLSEVLDGHFLAETANAGDTIDDGDLGGTAGNGITLSTSNVQNLFGKANRKLDEKNIPRGNRWTIITPQIFDILWQYIAGKESLLGDNTGKNGHVGSWAGFQLYMSNNAYATARLEFGTNPTNGDTITINGVVITFKDTLTAATGETEIHICGNAGATLDSLVAFINAPGTSVAEATNAGISSATAAEQALLRRITATDGATYMTIAGIGKSYITVSETLTAAGDVWTATLQLQHALFGYKKPIDMVIQKRPTVVLRPVQDKLGVNVMPYTLFGLKTFAEGAVEMLDAQLRSDAY